MPGIHDYWLFVLSGILLNLTPGQDTFFILGNSLGAGRRAGVAAALGIAAGSIVHTLAAALGLSAILATSATAFTVVKLLGAAYLIYIGVRALGSRTLVPENFEAGGAVAARIVATVAPDATTLEPQFISAISTIRIDVPSLAERLEDLPLLCQFFLEAANRGSQKQVGSLRPTFFVVDNEVLDRQKAVEPKVPIREPFKVKFVAHSEASTSCRLKYGTWHRPSLIPSGTS